MATMITIKRPGGATSDQWIEPNDVMAREQVRTIRAKQKSAFDPATDKYPWTVTSRKVA